MNELNKINNEQFLKELGERIGKGEIKVEGDRLVGKSEKNDYSFFAISLNIDVGNLVNTVIKELKEEKALLREDKEKWELEVKELRKVSKG